MTEKHIQHLYWRAGFGISAKALKELRTKSRKTIVKNLFNENHNFQPLTADFSSLQVKVKTLSQEEKRAFRKLRNQKMQELNLAWLQKLKDTPHTFNEKMVLFFQNHFSVRIKNPRALLHLNNIIRKNALGNFGTMLMEVSKSPAMLLFLNNRQNRKGQPNENFAREVMELFTLGRDNGYTEKDVKEAARAFTGWNFDHTGAFVFRAKHHDEGVKTFLGRSGNFKGEDIIKILLEEKQTARYLTEKIYNHFVSENSNENRITELSTFFYKNDYDISSLMRFVFESDWFYEDQIIGSKIKSPIDLIIGLSRQFSISYENPKILLLLQKKLNQMLFFPPNVAGWPEGKYWIDNSTLMLRMKLPSVLLNKGMISIEEKENMPEDMVLTRQGNQKLKSFIQRKVKTKPDWESFLSSIKDKNKEELIDYMIQSPLSTAASKVVSGLDDTNKRSFITELMSLPEYQLC